MFVDSVLFVNFIVGVTVVLQGIVPTMYVAKHGGFWMYVIVIILTVFATITSLALLIARKSSCARSMNPSKLGLYHLPMAASFLFSLILSLMYAFIIDVSTENGAVRNMILVLAGGIGFLLLTSLLVVVLAFTEKRKEPTERESD